MKKQSTIWDVIEEGTFFGHAAPQLPHFEHQYFQELILMGIALGTTKALMLIIEAFQNPEKNSDNEKVFLQEMHNYVAAFFEDEQENEWKPEYIESSPELIAALAKLIAESCFAHAEFYRNVCREILQKHATAPLLTSREGQTLSGKELSSYFHQQTTLRDISSKYYTPDIIAPGIYVAEMEAYHLAMTLINPSHNPLGWKGRLRPFYDLMRETRQNLPMLMQADIVTPETV